MNGPTRILGATTGFPPTNWKEVLTDKYDVRPGWRDIGVSVTGFTYSTPDKIGLYLAERRSGLFYFENKEFILALLYQDKNKDIQVISGLVFQGEVDRTPGKYGECSTYPAVFTKINDRFWPYKIN